VVINPGHVDPGAGSFRSYPAGGDADPTERLHASRSASAQRLVTQPAVERRAPEQPVRGQRTRRTVDLPAPTHRALDIWQREAADRLGVARVTGQEVLTALIDQLLADPKLSSQITRAIQARR
jgi:hypothetical protein